jgi:2-iminobutanoate/2-iminopropanoate deaminase
MSVIIDTPDAPGAIGPYVQGRLCGKTLYTSGCVAIDPYGGPTPETAEAQMAMCLKNMGAIIAKAGFKITDVVKTTVFLQDMNDFANINKVYAEFFGDHKPCRTCVQAGKLPAGKLVEVDCIAVKE